MALSSHLECVLCKDTYRLDEDRLACWCGGLLSVRHDLAPFKQVGAQVSHLFSGRKANPRSAADRSGVWRFRELVLPQLAESEIVTRGEGNTRLYVFERTNRWLGLDGAVFKHEGENPTGSFKDRGLTAAVSWAKKCGAKIVACASTGNTSAAVASYASMAGLPAIILIPDGQTALGKISQSLAYGAKTLKVRGDFDAALKLVLAARQRIGVTVLNSVNPFRLEGQKTIIWELLEQLDWNPPDWIVVPGGNLGNASAFGKALEEALEIGLIRKVPRLAVIQASGANPFYRSSLDGWRRQTVSASTIATAIRIGDPVNFHKAVKAIRFTQGAVAEVTDDEIMEAKAVIDSDGVGAEPASCAAAAGIKKLAAQGLIAKSARVAAILTGHMLKDPDATVNYHGRNLPGITPAAANAPVVIDPTLEALERALG